MSWPEQTSQVRCNGYFNGLRSLRKCMGALSRTADSILYPFGWTKEASDSLAACLQWRPHLDRTCAQVHCTLQAWCSSAIAPCQACTLSGIGTDVRHAHCQALAPMSVMSALHLLREAPPQQGPTCIAGQQFCFRPLEMYAASAPTKSVSFGGTSTIGSSPLFGAGGMDKPFGAAPASSGVKSPTSPLVCLSACLPL